MPQRIQLKRTKGWRKPEGAVSVVRPSKWGNPYKIVSVECDAPAGGMCYSVTFFGKPRIEHIGGLLEATEWAVTLFRASVEDQFTQREIRHDLAGKDLACWCRLSAPCHADVLLSIANGGTE